MSKKKNKLKSLIPEHLAMIGLVTQKPSGNPSKHATPVKEEQLDEAAQEMTPEQAAKSVQKAMDAIKNTFIGNNKIDTEIMNNWHGMMKTLGKLKRMK